MISLTDDARALIELHALEVVREFHTRNLGRPMVDVMKDADARIGDLQEVLGLADNSAARIAELERALDLASHRLARCAVEVLGSGKANQYEWSEWANEARAVAKGGPDRG